MGRVIGKDDGMICDGKGDGNGHSWVMRRRIEC